MDYATAIDVGERKRGSGINEDSVAVCLFADGHRDGLVHAGSGRAGRSTGGPGDGTTGGGPGGTSAGDGPGAVNDGPTDLESLLATSREEAASDGADGTRPGSESAGARRDGPPGGSDGPVDLFADPVDDQPDTRTVAVFALADGAGGYDAGDVASYIATTVVSETLAPVAVRAARSDPDAFGVDLTEPLPEPPTTAEFQAAIDEAIQRAHRSILRYADAASQPSYTTVVAGLVVAGEVHYGWVGDSRAYVVNESAGRIEQLTRDHSVVADLLEADEITEVEAKVHPRGNEITAALGGHPGEDADSAAVGVETHTVPLWREDVLLVTSDGLIDAQTDAPALHNEYVVADGSDEVRARIRDAVVTDDELRDGVLSAATLGDAADHLVDLANHRGGKDNLSLVLLRDPSLPTAPAPGDMPTRAIDPDEPLEDRQTVILPDE